MTNETAQTQTIGKTLQGLPKLKAVFEGKKTLLIVMQDNPDPDAIASAVGLRELANRLAGISCSLAHGGIVGRAENRAIVRYLNLNLRPMDSVDPQRFDLIAMVDTQPTTGNNLLGDEFIPDIVIDHHPICNATRRSRFTDIRGKYGATSTIIFEYLKVAEIELAVPVATALLYGIRSDTQDLGREAYRADTDAFMALYRSANPRMLSTIANATVPAEYFQELAVALIRARVCGNCLITSVGTVQNPDMIAEVADYLLRLEDTQWVLCHGVYKQRLLLSMRTSDPSVPCGQFMKSIVKGMGTGGGHDTFAGGQVQLTKGTRKERDERERTIRRRYLERLGFNNCRPTRLVRPRE